MQMAKTREAFCCRA